MNIFPTWLVAACLIPIAFGVGCAAVAVIPVLINIADRVAQVWRNRHKKHQPVPPALRARRPRKEHP